MAADAVAAQVLTLLPVVVDDGFWGRDLSPAFDELRLVGDRPGTYAAAAAARVLRRVAPALPVELTTPARLRMWSGPATGTRRRLTVVFQGSGSRASSLSDLAVAVEPAPAGAEPAGRASARGSRLLGEIVTGIAFALAVRRATIGGMDRGFGELLDAFLGLPTRTRSTLAMCRGRADGVARSVQSMAGFLTVASSGNRAYADLGAELLADGRVRSSGSAELDDLSDGRCVALPLDTAIVAVGASGAPVLRCLAARGFPVITVDRESAASLPIDTLDESPWGPAEAIVALTVIAETIETERRMDGSLGHQPVSPELQPAGGQREPAGGRR